MAKAKIKKITLKIEAQLTPEGDNVPFELSYNDETFEIHNPVKGMKLFDGAQRWRCMIDGRPTDIFNIEDNWWMIKE